MKADSAKKDLTKPQAWGKFERQIFAEVHAMQFGTLQATVWIEVEHGTIRQVNHRIDERIIKNR